MSSTAERELSTLNDVESGNVRIWKSDEKSRGIDAYIIDGDVRHPAATNVAKLVAQGLVQKPRSTNEKPAQLSKAGAARLDELRELQQVADELNVSALDSGVENEITWHGSAEPLDESAQSYAHALASFPAVARPTSRNAAARVESEHAFAAACERVEQYARAPRLDARHELLIAALRIAARVERSVRAIEQLKQPETRQLFESSSLDVPSMLIHIEGTQLAYSYAFCDVIGVRSAAISSNDQRELALYALRLAGELGTELPSID